jgi:hypothetical protein
VDQLSGNGKADDATTNDEDIGVRFGHNLSSDPISAKLFCKRSQVAFMPYGVILKDERRTSNIERPTSNEKQTPNTEHSTAISGFFSRFNTRNENLN